MLIKLSIFTSLCSLMLFPVFPAYVVAENDIGPHDEGDLDGDVDVDMTDVGLLDLFVGGQQEPEQWQFWRADIHPFTLNGSDLCPQGDGVLTWDDVDTLEYIADRFYNFEYDFSHCPYDFDHDGYIDYRSPGGDDCDDTREFVNPGQVEECGAPTCSDNFDNDCDGVKDAADPDCREWCPSAAEASTIGAASSSTSKPINFFAFLLVPAAAVLIWKGLRRKR